MNEKISKEIVPEDLLKRFVASHFQLDSSQYWLFRRAFTQQFAMATFMCYVLAFGHRTPSKYSICMQTGQVSVHEVLPSTRFGEYD